MNGYEIVEREVYWLLFPWNQARITFYRLNFVLAIYLNLDANQPIDGFVNIVRNVGVFYQRIPYCREKSSNNIPGCPGQSLFSHKLSSTIVH